MVEVEVDVGGKVERFPAHYDRLERGTVDPRWVLTPDYNDNYEFRCTLDGQWFGMKVR